MQPKTSRSPVMEATETEVQAVLDTLKAQTSSSRRAAGRVARYSHNVERVLQVPSQSAAILTVLMLRGPQTPGELRINYERLQLRGHLGSSRFSGRARRGHQVALSRSCRATRRAGEPLGASAERNARSGGHREACSGGRRRRSIARLEGEIASLKACSPVFARSLGSAPDAVAAVCRRGLRRVSVRGERSGGDHSFGRRARRPFRVRHRVLIFAAFCLNSVISIAFTLRYRQPLISRGVSRARCSSVRRSCISFPEVIGAFVATGVLMVLLGLSGWVRRAMDAVPMPIVMAMVAGVFLRFGIDLVLAFPAALWIALPMTVAFFVFLKVNRYVPPLIAALATGAVAIWALGAFNAPAGAALRLRLAQLLCAAIFKGGDGRARRAARHHGPRGAERARHRHPRREWARGAGERHHHRMRRRLHCHGTFRRRVHLPDRAGQRGFVEHGGKPRQYTAALSLCVLAIAFAALAPFFTRVLLATPPAFIATLAGLAMLKVLQTAFTASFGGKFSFGALVCFLVTVADVAIFRIGAPFWGSFSASRHRGCSSAVLQ